MADAPHFADAPGAAEADMLRALTRWNRERLAPRTPRADWRADLAHDHAMALTEGAFLERAAANVSARADAAPRDADAFLAWFEALEHDGPGQGDALFPWLAERADMDAMRWFLAQEVAGEAGFDDLVALAQIKAPVRAKLELARNYWDEMGRGNAKGMHGPMLAHLAAELELAPDIDATLPAPLALGAVMIGLCANRRYAYHALGALGVIELTAPGRAAHVAAGLKRLGVGAHVRRYFDLHAVLDVKHAAAWNREVIHPLVAEDPARAPCIAAGALMRLACGAACFDAYRAHLWAA